MKKLVFLVVVLFFSTLGFAQKISTSQVPVAVKKTLLAKLNDTIVNQWEKDGDMYKAVMLKGEMTANAFINVNGVWNRTVWFMPYKYAPKKINEYIVKNFPKYKVTAMSMQFRTDGDFYVIDVKKKKEIQSVTFNMKSEFVRSEKK
jgi:hypothetical protein